jgi:hypothetical protein
MSGKPGYQDLPRAMVVLVGSPHAGKAAILHRLGRLHDAPPLRSLPVAGCLVVTNDFLWPEPLADGRFLHVDLHTLYGAPDHRAIPRLLLQGADGIVFLADTEPKRIAHAPDQLRAFLADIAAVEVDLARTVVALQYHRTEECPGFDVAGMNHFLQIPADGELECFATTADPGDDAGAAIEWVVRQIALKATARPQAATG